MYEALEHMENQYLDGADKACTNAHPRVLKQLKERGILETFSVWGYPASGFAWLSDAYLEYTGIRSVATRKRVTSMVFKATAEGTYFVTVRRMELAAELPRPRSTRTYEVSKARFTSALLPLVLHPELKTVTSTYRSARVFSHKTVKVERFSRWYNTLKAK